MLTDKWNLYTSYTYNNSEYQSNDPSAYNSEGELLEDASASFKAGDEVIDSAQDLFVVSADYYSGDFRFGLSAKYTGERLGAWTDEQTRSRNEVDGYTLVDLNIGYNTSLDSGVFKSIDLAFVVNNLFDKSYLAGGTGNGSTYFIGAPRTAALTLTAQF